MPTRDQLAKIMAAEFEFPQIRRTDDPMYVEPKLPNQNIFMQTITVDLHKPIKIVVMDGDQIAFTTIVHTPHFRVKKRKSTLRFDVVTVDIGSQHVPFTKG